MKTGLVLIILMFLMFLPIISSEIILNQQPAEIYGLGDTITIPVTIKSLTTSSGLFQMNLICEGREINFYRNGVSLLAGEEKKMETSLILTKSIIEEIIGECKIKGIYLEEYVLTNEFTISNLLTINLKTEETEFEPGKSILLTGNVIKETKGEVNGFIKLNMQLDNLENSTGDIEQLGTINRGFFSVNMSLPKGMKAGPHLIKLEAYERDAYGTETNRGSLDYTIKIKQVPANLEIFIEDSEPQPGTTLKVKAILHDQTGEKIDSIVIITIKTEKDKVLEQSEIAVDEFLEMPIAYNQPPIKWKIIALSNKISSESIVKIAEKEDIKIELLNRTLILKNTGNVPYNKTILVKIGNEFINNATPIDVFLKVDEEQKYVLTAPDGEYQVEVIIDGEKRFVESVVLTGKAIDVKETGGVIGVVGLMRYPLVWIFIIGILGFIAFMIFRKGYKRSFVGQVDNVKEMKESEIPLGKKSVVKTKNKAELSLSIKGDKQNVSLVCLRVKNLNEIQQSKEGNAEEVLQRVVNISEESKAVVYENQDFLFFILAPARTKTFNNEKTVISLAEKIKREIEDYNKVARQKIRFGISLNSGEIIAKQEKEIFKFMSMGTLVIGAKRISSASEGEILLGEKIREKLISEVKTRKERRDGIDVYILEEVRQRDGDKKFLSEFVKRMEKK